MDCGVSIMSSNFRVPGGSACFDSMAASNFASAETCSGHGDFRQSDDEIFGQAAGFGEQRGEEQIQRPDGARAQDFGKRLDADSDEWRETRLSRAASHGLRGETACPSSSESGRLP